MKRREFLKKFGLLTAAVPFLPTFKKELEPLRKKYAVEEKPIQGASVCCTIWDDYISSSSCSSSSSSINPKSWEWKAAK